MFLPFGFTASLPSPWTLTLIGINSSCLWDEHMISMRWSTWNSCSNWFNPGGVHLINSLHLLPFQDGMCWMTLTKWKTRCLSSRLSYSWRTSALFPQLCKKLLFVRVGNDVHILKKHHFRTLGIFQMKFQHVRSLRIFTYFFKFQINLVLHSFLSGLSRVAAPIHCPVG